MRKDPYRIGMVIHELTTNAAKYGALSSTSGRIEVRWTFEAAQDPDNDSEAQVALDWRERGGPAVRVPVLRTAPATTLCSICGYPPVRPVRSRSGTIRASEQCSGRVAWDWW